jgi:putative permease
MKRLALLTATVCATLVGVWLLWQFREVLLLFALSLVLSAALRPLANRQEAALKVPRPVAVLTIFLLALAFVAVVVFALSAPLLDDLRRAADQFVLTYDNVWATWPVGSAFQRSLVVWLPPPQELYGAVAGASGVAMGRSLLGATLSLVDLISRASIVVVMSIYWSVDQARLERLWLSLLPAGERARALDIWRAMETGLGAYLRSELIQSFLAGLLLGAGYWILRLPYPALLATLSALVWLIPWLGAVLGLGLVLLAGLTTSPWVTLAACIYTLLVFAVLEFRVEPKLYNRRQFSSLLVVVLVLGLWDSAGLFGLVAAPPLAAALQILFRSLTLTNPIPVKEPLQARFTTLECRLASLDASLQTAPEAPPPQVASLVTRLGALVAETRRVLSREGALPGEAISKAQD